LSQTDSKLGYFPTGLRGKNASVKHFMHWKF